MSDKSTPITTVEKSLTTVIISATICTEQVYVVVEMITVRDPLNYYIPVVVEMIIANQL